MTLKSNYLLVQHPPRLVPVMLKSAYEEEIKWLCNEGIITPVWDHTEWTNAILSVRKANGSLRLLGSRGPQQEYREEPVLHQDNRQLQHKTPWVLPMLH